MRRGLERGAGFLRAEHVFEHGVGDLAEAAVAVHVLHRHGGEPRIGAHGTPIIFVHPKDMGGVLVELMETPKGAHH